MQRSAVRPAVNRSIGRKSDGSWAKAATGDELEYCAQVGCGFTQARVCTRTHARTQVIEDHLGEAEMAKKVAAVRTHSIRARWTPWAYASTR